MKSQFIATITQRSQTSKAITIPKAIADLWKNGTKVKITMEIYKNEIQQ